MRLWHKHDVRQNAQRLIHFLLSEHSGTGWSIDWKNVAAWGELAYSAQPVLSRGIVLRVLTRMVEEKVDSVEAFERIYEDIQQSKASIPNERWRYLLPLEIRVPKSDLPVRFRIFEHDFYLIAASSFKRYLKPQNLRALPLVLSRRCSFQKEISRYTFFTALVDAPDWRAGWQRVAPAFDAFRGMLNLSLSFYQLRLTFNTPRPWGIRHPCWGMMISRHTEEPFFFIGERGESSKIIELSEEVVKALKRNLYLLKNRPPKGSTLELIADSLRLYSQAMDTSLPHWRLLGFWQLAESITVAEDVGGDTAKVAHRLSWLGSKIGLEASGYRYTLLALGQKRNQIVHRGIGDVDEEDINILKLACEAGIHWLFSVVKDLPTVQHIRQFYRFKDMGKKQREVIGETLRFINSPTP
ncbi:MAG: hypothetical protein GXO35_05225 [Gammaproteobacteria bacterium]|nr:hypothetical protein [Gammaproteobacteria bacterium]